MKGFQEIIDSHSKIVFFGGAGVSTESGIPDFRGSGGINLRERKIPVETILSHSFFFENTAVFYEFYFNEMLTAGAEPNDAHKKLAELERAGKLTAVITQNIDSLHQRAGSKTVYELHGSAERNYCVSCEKFFSLKNLFKKYSASEKGVPLCECGGVIKPDVVLYGEMLNEKTVCSAQSALREADCLIVGGTSLSVYPAAGLVNVFGGETLVIINKTPTAFNGRASAVFTRNIGELFKTIKL